MRTAGRAPGYVWLAAGAVGVVLAAVIVVWAWPSAAPPAPAAATATALATPTRSAVSPLPSPSRTPSRAAPPTKSAPGAAELEPVKPGEVVQGEDGMKVALTSIEAVTGEAVQPGEVSGPAIRVTVQVTNETGREFNTSSIAVNAYTGKARVPAGTLVQPGGVPFYGRLAPGESTYGVYLFAIAADQRSDVTITVDYSAAVAVVVFQGDMS